MKKKLAHWSRSAMALVLAFTLVMGMIPAISSSAAEVISLSINEKMPTNNLTLSVGAGQTVSVDVTAAAYYNLIIEESDITVTLSGREYPSTDGKVEVFLAKNAQSVPFEITNHSSSDKNLKLKFRRYDGHKQMPYKLEAMSNFTVEQSAVYANIGNENGTYYSWTAPADGTVKMSGKVTDGSGMGVYITINENNTSTDGSIVMEVKKGDNLSIQIVAHQEGNMLAPNATIQINASFTEDGAQIPVEPTDPEPTDPTDPEPTNPTDPEPTDPTDPEPTDPTDPEPTDPEPSNPTNPTDPSEPEEPSNPFTDVFEGKFYYDAVLWAVDNEVTTGKTATTFAPNEDCTRGQVVTFLWRAKGEPEPTSTTNPFVDTKESAYYYKAMLWAVENGITKGISDDQFAPNKQCSRAEVVTFLWRAVGSPEADNQTHPFTDITAGSFYYQAMLWAVENKVTEGVSATTFAPKGICNRGQTVTFLYRAVAE